MSYCHLCPNDCGVNRKIAVGKCGEKAEMRIAKYYLHPYEEPFISGKNGSGTVFFSGCGLKCVFCQNFELSRSERGKTITPADLTAIFKELENAGAHNINLVSPTHFADKIYEAVKIYRPNVPIVYNTSGYESLSGLEIPLKFADIFLPDLKYYSSFASERYAKIPDYFEKASAAIIKMMQSRKTVVEDGLMRSGVCVRHLLLPLNLNETEKIIEWFAENVSGGAYFSLMAQYTPFGDIENYPELKRPVTKREYNRAVDKLLSSGVENCFIQQLDSSGEKFIPKWDF